MVLAPDDADGFAELLDGFGYSVASLAETQSDNEYYSYTVDWGDGTPVQEFVSWEETPEAVWHEYKANGTYDVTVNGIFYSIRNNRGESGWLIIDGEYYTDSDGSNMLSAYNRGNTLWLSKVIAWGNTRLRNLFWSFRGCTHLTQIPTTDTTNSFEGLTSCESCFSWCYGLKEIPYDSNTGRGMFSNCPNVTTFQQCFWACSGMTGEIPPALIDNCPKVYTITSMFGQCYNLTGSIPFSMFKGMSALASGETAFAYASGLTGELDASLFDDCPNLVNTALMFTGTGISGVVPSGLFKNNPNLNYASSMFQNCPKITGVESGFLSGVTASTLQCAKMFENCVGITSIPENLFAGLSSSTVYAPCMFRGCSGITSLPSTLYTDLSSITDARAMFAGTVQVTSYPTYVVSGDETIDSTRKFWALFGYWSYDSALDATPREFGGFGVRLLPNAKYGMILLADGSCVEHDAFVYDETNKPVGMVFDADDDGLWIAPFNRLLTNPINQQIDQKLWQTIPLSYANDVNLWTDPHTLGVDNTNIILTSTAYIGSPDSFPMARDTAAYATDGYPAGSWHMPIARDWLDVDVAVNMFGRCVIRIRGNGDYNDSTCYPPYPTGEGYNWTCQVSPGSYSSNLYQVNWVKTNNHYGQWPVGYGVPVLKIVGDGMS